MIVKCRRWGELTITVLQYVAFSLTIKVRWRSHLIELLDVGSKGNVFCK